jgi:alpha-tubulin suppressor-like RCC1 family protein
MPTNADITDVYLGGAYAQELYLGSTRIWPLGTLGLASVSGYILALRSNGTPVWDRLPANYPQLNTIPEITRGNTTMVSMGERHAMALLKNKTVVCWGANTQGQINTPANLTNVREVFAAGLASYAILENGTVRHWGTNAQGAGNIPAGLTDVVGLGSFVGGGSGTHVVACKSNGTVVTWGTNNTYGQQNVPAGLNRVIKVSAVFEGSIALQDDGTVVKWGFENTYTPIPSSVSPVDLVDMDLKTQYELYVLRLNGNLEVNNNVVATGVVAMARGGRAYMKQDGTTHLI